MGKFLLILCFLDLSPFAHQPKLADGPAVFMILP